MYLCNLQYTALSMLVANLWFYVQLLKGD